MPQAERGLFESRFGSNFSGVRVHTGAQAAETARRLNARAFTVGRDVVFAAGQYTPGTEAGNRLLAHELAHTVQQNRATGAPKACIQRTIGDGHDLQSPRFAGDTALEACYDDETRLTKGAAGEPVRKVQQALYDLGYDLGPSKVDGIYGDFTWNAVKKFKADQGLGWEWMGDVGPGTMARLDILFPSEKPPTGKPPKTTFTCPVYMGDSKLEACLNDEDRLRPGDTGASVRKVQNGLLNDNIYVGESGADGIYGEKTSQAVMAFKKKHDLGHSDFPDVGPGTMQKMDELCGEVAPCADGESAVDMLLAPSTACPCWKIDGEIATAGQCAKLGILAKCLTGNEANWPCIWPDNMKSPMKYADNYQKYVQPGDTFDISNFAITTGSELTYSFRDPADEYLRATSKIYGGSDPTADLDNQLGQDANRGTTPIKSLTITGHTPQSGDEIHGGGNALNVGRLNPDLPAPTGVRADMGMGPRRCWFTKNARLRVVGCESGLQNRIAPRLAGIYLRKPHSSWPQSDTEAKGTIRTVCGVDQKSTYLYKGELNMWMVCPGVPLFGEYLRTKEQCHSTSDLWTGTTGRA
ncbi:MAG: DUF4157 domain-containing protein [Anaerolineales bacterium]